MTILKIFFRFFFLKLDCVIWYLLLTGFCNAFKAYLPKTLAKSKYSGRRGITYPAQAFSRMMSPSEEPFSENEDSFQVDIRSLEKLWQPEEMGAVPTNSREGAQDVVKAARAALFEGKRGQIVDIQAPLFDPTHRVYDQEAFFDFIGALLHGLTFAGNVRIIARDDDMAIDLQERLYIMSEGDMDGIKFSSFLGPEGGRTGMGELEVVARYAPALTEEEDSIFVVLLPTSMGEMVGLRKVVEIAEGRPILILNPRMETPPIEIKDFETVYAVLPFVVQEQGERSRDRPPGQILLKKEFPDAWKFYINQDGQGYQYVNAFEERPSGDEMISLYLQMRS